MKNLLFLCCFAGLQWLPAIQAAENHSAAGITEPFGDVVLSASVAGIINIRPVEEGDALEAGAIVLELDKSLEVLEVDRRKLVLNARQRVLEDTQTLYKNSKGVSHDELEKAELDYRVAVVEHAMAEEQLKRRVIKAPFAGRVVEVFLDAGEATQAYQPLARLVDTQRCYFICNIEAKSAGGLQQDQWVRLAIESGAEPVSVRAKIIYLSPVVDPASGLLKVKALFNNSEGKLRPGLAGRMFWN